MYVQIFVNQVADEAVILLEALVVCLWLGPAVRFVVCAFSFLCASTLQTDWKNNENS